MTERLSDSRREWTKLKFHISYAEETRVLCKEEEEKKEASKSGAFDL